MPKTHTTFYYSCQLRYFIYLFFFEFDIEFSLVACLKYNCLKPSKELSHKNYDFKWRLYKINWYNILVILSYFSNEVLLIILKFF